MADDTSRLEALVARLIQDKLGQEGGLEDLLRAVREVEQSFPARDESGNEGSEPVRVDTAFAGEGTLKGAVNVVVVPTVRATMTLLPPTLGVVPDKTLDAVRSALPELADEIHTRPQDATVLINLFAALVQLLATAVTLYQIIHPQAPTLPQIVEIFNRPTTW